MKLQDIFSLVELLASVKSYCRDQYTTTHLTVKNHHSTVSNGNLVFQTEAMASGHGDRTQKNFVFRRLCFYLVVTFLVLCLVVKSHGLKEELFGQSDIQSTRHKRALPFSFGNELRSIARLVYNNQERRRSEAASFNRERLHRLGKRNDAENIDIDDANMRPEEVDKSGNDASFDQGLSYSKRGTSVQGLNDMIADIIVQAERDAILREGK